jgi:chromosome partitioning protein
MICVAIANQKGGVGKTTTAINIATAMAATGWKTLLIDLDPQGNASTGIGIGAADREFSSYDLIVDQRPLIDCIMPTKIPGLDIMPATVDLSGAEVELVSVENRTDRMRDALAGHTGHDICFIDCPPSLGLLTLNAMTAADTMLVPLQCEFFALEGLSQLMRTIEMVRANLNPKLEIQGIVLTMFDRRNGLSTQVGDDVRSHFGETVYQTVIPRNVRVSEAPSFGKPALVYDLKCAGSQAYLRLAREVVLRERARRKVAA